MSAEAHHDNSEPKVSRVRHCHLHVHSEYSLTDGMISLSSLVARAKQLGHTHVGLTDHANLYGVIDFYSAAKAVGIKPVIGCEVFIEPSAEENRFLKSRGVGAGENQCLFKAILIAKTTLGYKNLIKIVSRASTDKKNYPVSVVKRESLFSLAEDLFFWPSFHGGEFSTWLMALGGDEFATNSQSPFDVSGKVRSAGLPSSQDALEFLHQAVQSYRQHFPDRMYVEICRNLLPHEPELLRRTTVFAKHFSLPLVATANAHYLLPEQREAHTILLGVKNDLKMPDMRNRRKNARAHLLDNAEFESAFAEWPEAILNTQRIADQCEVKFEFGKFYLPKIDLSLDATETTSDSLRRLAREGLNARMVNLRELYGKKLDTAKEQEYWDRLEYETEVIIKMGFPDYFLIVQDFINWAKSQDIPVGPGRGSGAGSLVAYALRITDLDPLPYNLIFERFLNPERVSMPDFDVDFCQDRRDEVIRYVSEKYGKDQVAQIVTFGKMLAKAAVRDVGRVLDLSFKKVDNIARLIPNEIGIKLKDAMEREPGFQELVRLDPLYGDVLKFALELEGLNRHTSVHAAGVVISDGKMEEYVPTEVSSEGNLVTQFEMKNAEKVGLVKFDFLGLKTLTVIQHTIRRVAKSRGIKLDIEKIPLDDKKVYELISKSLSVGVFQLESRGMQQLLLKLKPSNFEDVIALVALFRPGPLQSGMVDDFVERKHGRREIEYLHPELEPILRDTYGTILYQEQVQKIAANLASYTLGEADLLRRAMGKKKPEEMAQQKSRFVEGSVARGIGEEIANTLFDQMAKFAEYGFNKSHSAAYGLVSYQTAFLKTYYTAEFLAASLGCDKDNTEKVVRYCEDAKNFSIKISPPCINQSDIDFKVCSPREIRFALSGIKGIGEACLETLIENREQNGPFRGLSDLARRVNLVKVGKKTMELLIQAGALDCFGLSRQAMLDETKSLMNYSTDHHGAKSTGQVLLFDDFTSEDEELDPFVGLGKRGKVYPNHPSVHHELFEERKIVGLFLSSHPILFYAAERKAFLASSIEEMMKSKDGKEFNAILWLTETFEMTTKDERKMRIFRMQDETGAISPALFQENWPDPCPMTEGPVYCKLRRQKSFSSPDGFSLNLVFLESFEPLRLERIKSINLELEEVKGADDLADLPSELVRLEQELVHISRNFKGASRLSVTIPYQNKGRVTVDLSAGLAPTDKTIAHLGQFGKVRLS